MPKLKPIEAKTQTADEAYQRAKLDAFKKIAKLSKRVHYHDLIQRQDPKNWGFVGDIHRMNDLLDEILGGCFPGVEPE